MTSRRNILKYLGLTSAAAGLIQSDVVKEKIGEIADLESTVEGKKKFTVNILQTTDVHCQIHPHDELFWENEKSVFRKTGGYAHIATFFKKERKKNKNTFIIDTGDMFQGSELSVKTTGKAMSEILNALNYDLFLPGNWEVIYYKKAMQKLLGGLNAPKVCANMYHENADGTKGELIFPPYYIWHINGVKIAFLGYTDHLVPLRQSPNYSKGIIYTKPEENLAHYVDVLKNQEQCEMINIVAHLGLSQQLNLANLEACEGVSYILGGDTHERVRKPIQCKYAKVVEPGAFGSFVGKLEVTFEDGKMTEDKYTLEEVGMSSYKADKQLAEIIKNNEKPFEEQINKVVGYSTIPLFRYFVIENPIDTMILHALHWKMKDIDIVLSNGFRFCPPRTTPDSTGNIPITEGYIFDMLPVDSTVRTAEVTGKQILNWLEKEMNNVFAKNAAERFGGWVIKFLGMKVEFYAFGDNGKRIKSVTIKGESLNETRTYSICACERDGDPDDMLCRIKGVKNAKNTTNTLHSVMKEYLTTNSPVTPAVMENAIVLDAPKTLLSQVTGVDYKFQ